MSAIEKIEEYKLIAKFVFDKHNKVTLSAKETAALIGKTESSLKKDREENIGIPFTRLNRKESGKPLYSVTAIAKTIVENQIKIF